MRTRLAVPVALILLMSATACSSSPTDVPPQVDASTRFRSTVDRAVQEARAGGASPAQLDVLTRSAASGTVTFEQYQGAVLKTLDCVKAAGIDVDGPRVVQRQGIAVIDFSTASSSPGRSDEQTDALAQQCIRRHSLWIDLAYNNSPASVQAKEADFAPYRKPLLDCLHQHHVTVDDNAYAGDLFTKAGILQQRDSTDCIKISGFPMDQGFTW